MSSFTLTEAAGGGLHSWHLAMGDLATLLGVTNLFMATKQSQSLPSGHCCPLTGTLPLLILTKRLIDPSGVGLPVTLLQALNKFPANPVVLMAPQKIAKGGPTSKEYIRGM